jgi:septal ring factor EnvC (AmiA/AmiB activator)
MIFSRLFRLHFIFLAMVLLPLNLAAQSRKSLEEQRKKTLQEIEETNAFLNEIRQNQKESVEKLNLLNAQVTQYNRLISGMNDEISYVERQINETAIGIKQMSNEIEKLKSEYAQMVFQAYKNRGKYNKLIYILSARDFNEAYRRMKYFQQYTGYRKNQVTEIIAIQKQLGETMEKLTARKAEKEKLLATRRKETQRLETVKTEQGREVGKLKTQERKLRQQLAEQQRRAQKLRKDIEQLIAAETKKRQGTSKNLYDKLTPGERLVSNNFKDNKGRLPWPTEKGIITGYFGMHMHPFLKYVTTNNSGVDITTVGGASVRAVFDGEVARIWGIRGENIIVLLRHGNFITVYQNLVDISVKQGDKIKIKDIIGKVYTEKNSKTAVLHFEIWEESNTLNPEQWMIKR